MKSYQAPHEKLTEEEIKEQIESILSNHLKFKDRWEASDWEEYEFHKFMENQESMIFKLRRHFSPEKTTIMQISLAELTKMMEYPKYEP